MNQTKIVVTILLALSTNILQAQTAKQCLETAYLQQEMNRCIEETKVHFKDADAELNRTYKEVQKSYTKDKRFLKKLKSSQLAWIKLRDADFEMQFPHAKESGYYGSIFSTCADNYKVDLTLQRVLFLKKWIRGVEEGNVCAGSKKIAITDDEEESEIKKVCYQTVSPYKDGSKMKDVVDLILNINYGNGTVKGIYNYLPAEKDQRLGTIDGGMWKGAVSAKYTFEQEGETSSVNLRIHIKDKVAIVKGEEKDKALGLFGEFKQVNCQ